MNQILKTKPDNKKINSIKRLLRFQFYFSLIIIFIIVIFITYNTFLLYKKEKYSSQVLNNYNITKLYSNLLSNELLDSHANIEENSYVIGIIKIPKINVYYPIFSTYNDELLKISPCRFYGPLPGEVGNLCIAGHNYDSSKFFSKIATLNIDDEIIIYNHLNKKFSYFVFDIYEVKSDDLSPIYSYDNNSRQLTLVTCNNLNNNRIIVNALYK